MKTRAFFPCRKPVKFICSWRGSGNCAEKWRERRGKGEEREGREMRRGKGGERRGKEARGEGCKRKKG